MLFMEELIFSQDLASGMEFCKINQYLPIVLAIYVFVAVAESLEVNLPGCAITYILKYNRDLFFSLRNEP
jgi:hypothetical protein